MTIILWSILVLPLAISEALCTKRLTLYRDEIAKASDHIMQILTVGALAGPIILERVTRSYIPLAALILGSLSAVFGIMIRVLSMRELGGMYRLSPVVSSEDEIISDGVYGIVRHPGYSGLFISFIGLSIISDGFSGIVFVLFLLLPGIILRIGIEEKRLRNSLKNDYTAYAKEVPWKIIPFIL